MVCWGKQYLHVLGDLRRVGEWSTDGCLARNCVYSRRFVTMILIEDKVVHELSPRSVFGAVYSPLENSWLWCLFDPVTSIFLQRWCIQSKNFSGTSDVPGFPCEDHQSFLLYWHKRTDLQLQQELFLVILFCSLRKQLFSHAVFV